MPDVSITAATSTSDLLVPSFPQNQLPALELEKLSPRYNTDSDLHIAKQLLHNMPSSEAVSIGQTKASGAGSNNTNQHSLNPDISAAGLRANRISLPPSLPRSKLSNFPADNKTAQAAEKTAMHLPRTSSISRTQGRSRVPCHSTLIESRKSVKDGRTSLYSGDKVLTGSGSRSKSSSYIKPIQLAKCHGNAQALSATGTDDRQYANDQWRACGRKELVIEGDNPSLLLKCSSSISQSEDIDTSATTGSLTVSNTFISGTSREFHIPAGTEQIGTNIKVLYPRIAGLGDVEQELKSSDLDKGQTELGLVPNAESRRMSCQATQVTVTHWCHLAPQLVS